MAFDTTGGPDQAAKPLNNAEARQAIISLEESKNGCPLAKQLANMPWKEALQSVASLRNAYRTEHGKDADGIKFLAMSGSYIEIAMKEQGDSYSRYVGQSDHSPVSRIWMCKNGDEHDNGIIKLP